MSFVRVKRTRSQHRAFLQQRSFISVLLVTTLLSTYVSGASQAVENPNSPLQVPSLCDPSLITQPVLASPSPTPSPSEAPTQSPTPLPSESPTEVQTPTPSPSISETPIAEPTPAPSPTPEFLKGDYVAPDRPAAELGKTFSTEEVIAKVVCPSPVTNVIANSQNSQVLISWTPGVNAELNVVENITDYYIKVLETNEVIKVSSDKTSALVSGLKNKTTYSFIVYAASEYGSSLPSDLVTATPLSGNESEVAGLIVGFKDNTVLNTGDTDVPGEELVNQVDLTISNEITEDVRLVKFSEPTTLLVAHEIANEITKDKDVIWAEPDQFVYTSSIDAVNDPSFPTDQWNLWDKYGIGLGESKTQMSPAWSESAGEGINVAVIDTGITSHPDLDSQLVPGFDFVSSPDSLMASREENGEQVAFDGDYVNSEKYGPLGWDSNPTDPGDWRGVSPVRNSTWHGTHIAGVIAAQNNNQEGIAGIAPGAKIQPIRALSWRGGLLSDIATSITWASGGEIAGIENNPTPAKVINMSFSVNSVCPASLQAAINDAFARGSVLVAAAGNNNDDVKNYAPANCENVISVGASNKDGKRAAYSNYGLGIDVSAPGGDSNSNGGILSTSNSGLTEPASFGYATQQGTSISAAHVSAIAARIFSSNPTLTPLEVRAKIVNKESVREFADTQCDINADIYCGEGIVSLFQIAAACSPTQTTSGNYIIQTFTDSSVSSCEWTPSSGITKIDALLVAGGGGGGSRHGGGGGAGGVLWAQNFVVSNSQLSISIGSGGAGATGGSSGGTGSNGTNTTLKLTSNSANGLTASGGGGGGSGDGLAGGSGGASSYELSAVGTANQSSQTQKSLSGTTLVAGSNADGTTLTNYGNNGGKGIAEAPPNYCQQDWCGGGGGGAGAVGGNATISGFGVTSSNGLPGNGGVGIVNPISGSTAGQLVSSSYYLAGGGGGASSDSGLRGSGGSGGGGAGGNNLTAATAGTANTGGGGGGGGFIVVGSANANGFANQPGGRGGSGVLIIRYLAPPTIASASISGTQTIGSTLTASAGSTTGTISSTTYQWQYSADNSTWTNISGATSSTYTISGSTYRGNYLRVIVTVTNDGGTASATSSATSLIYYPDCSPTTTTPTVNGVVRNVYSFTTTGTCDWSIPAGVSLAEVLAVGGGGGAGHNSGGGGSGGGVYYQTALSVSGKVTITVGAGGAAGTSNSAGVAGGTSTFNNTTVNGGNGGGSSSGITGGASVPGSGLASGSGAGGNGTLSSSTAGTSGSAGPSISITGTATNYAGGGGGGGWINNTNGGSGGAGGGGRGGISGSNAGVAGTANTGGGGGASSVSTATSGAGGSGIVIVSAVASAPTITAISPSTGSVTGGSSVTITGTNFVSGQTTATINGISLTSVNVTSATSMTATLPNLTVGTHNLVVSNGSGSATSVGAFTVLAAPTIGSASISGNLNVGSTLTATANNVTGTSVTTTYQWQSSSTVTGTYSNISGATSSTYQITSTELNKYLRVVITVTNAGGTASATSTSNGSMLLAGTISSYLSIPNSTNLKFGTGNFTVEWWQYQTDNNNWPRVFEAQISGGTRDIAVSIEAGYFYWWTGGSALCRTAVGTYKSTWLHFAVSRSGTTTSVYKNGVLLCSFTDTRDYQPTTALIIGNQFSLDANTAFGGNITDFHWVKGTALYTSDFTVSSTPTTSVTNSKLLLNAANSAGVVTDSTSLNTATNNSVTWSSLTPFLVRAGLSAALTPTFNTPTPTADGFTVTITNYDSAYTFQTPTVSAGSVAVTSTSGSNRVLTVTGLSAGTSATITQQTSRSGYSSGSATVTGSSKATPSLTSISNISKTYGDSTFSLSAPTASVSGSTIAGSVSYSSSNTSVASVSGSTVTVVGAGTATFTATFTPTDTVSYNTTTTTFTITVAAKSLTITADTKSKNFGDSTPSNSYTLSTSLVGSDAISSLTYTYSGTNTTTAPTAVGSYTITPSNVSFSTGSASNYSISYSAGNYTISLANQATLTVSSTSGTYGTALTLTTSGGSGTGSVTYTATTGTASSCTVSGTSLTAGSAGTCLVTATKAADAQYNSISSSSTTVTFAQASQASLTVSSTSGTYGTSLTLTTSGGSGTGSVTYTATTGTASSCTVSGTSLTAGSAGTCLVTATKATDTNYLSVSSSQTTVTFAQASQSSLSISSTSGTYGTALTLTTSGGSGTGSVTYSATTGTASSCTVSGTSLTAGSAGTCLVTATKATDTNYLVASSSQTTITFAQASQSSLTVSSTSGTYGSALTLTTSGGSGTGSVTYTATTGTASSCTVSGTSLTAGSAGTCLVTATKASDTNYLSVSSSQTTVTFAKANQSSLTITSTSGIYGSALTLTTSGGTTAGSIVYAVSTGTASSCTESSGSLTAGSAGTCLVTATMAGSGSYETVSSSQTTITFAQASQSSLTVSSTSGTYGTALTLNTSGGSGTGSVTYTATTGTASSCTVSGTSLTAGSAGTCLITATKASDTNYSSASSSQTTVTFAKLSQSTLTVSSTSGTYGTSLTLTTSGGSGTGSVTYSATTGTASTCTVSGTSLTAGSAGTCLVTATKASDTNYLSESSTQTTVTFAKANQSSLTISTTSGTYGTPLSLSTSGGTGTGSVTYSATTGTASSCSISGSTLTAGSGGTCLVTATKASDTNYLSISSSETTITFALAAPTIASASISGGNAVGETLSAIANTVVGSSITTTYQWQSATTVGGTYSNISGATSSTYVLTSSESSKFVKVVITVTNSGGTASATSGATPVIVAAQTSWALLAAGARTSVFAETGSNATTLNNGTYFYNNPTASMGFAPISTITQGSADTYNSSLNTSSPACSAASQGDLRLSWHRSGGNISAGWRYGCSTSLNGSTTTFRAVYQASSLPSYYPSGPQKNVSTSTLQSGGWTLCYIGAYATAISFSTVSAACTETYILLSGGPGVILTTPTLTGFSNTSALFSESTKSFSAPTASVAGTFSYSSSNTSVASFASASTPTATLVGVGTATITATFTPTDTATYSSTTTTMTLTVSQGNQSTLSVSSTSGTYGTALTLTTSGGSGTGSVTYTATTGTASSCTVSGTSLTAGSAGTCLVTATKASSTNYLSASSAQTTVTFATASQSTLTVSSTSGTYGTALTLTTSGGSGTGSVTYTATTGTASSCTVSGTSLTAGSAGTCLVTATKASDSNYLSATSTQTTVTFAQLSQSTLSITSTSGTYGTALTLSSSGGSGTGSVSYTATTGTASSCSVSGTSLTAGSAGTCLVTATKASDTNYLLVSSSQTTITFAQASQSSLTLSSTSGTYGTALTLTTSGGSGTGSVTYSATTGTASSCTVSGTSLSAGSAGTCLVTATKASSTNYLSVTSTQTTVTFAKLNQSSLTITSTSGSYGTPLTLTTSGGNGDGEVTFTATAGTATSCTVSGTSLTAGSGGTCLVTATKAESTNYSSVSSTQTTVTFGKRSVTLTGFTDISNKSYGDSTFTLTAPTVSGSVAGSFSYSSGTTSVATISGSTVTIVGAGTSTITATFTPTDTASYDNKTATMLLTVNKKAITVTAEDKSKIYAATTPTNSFTNSTLVGSDAISSLTYTYSGTNSTTAPTTVGNYTITPSSATFSTGSSNNYTITYVPGAYSITKATPTFSGFNNVSKTFGNLPFTITAPTVSGSLSGSFTYSSSDISAITISGTTATVVGSGSSLITASFTPTDTTNYNSASTTMTVAVAKATQSSLSISSSSSVNYGSTISLTSSGGSGTGAVSFAVTSGTCSISSTTLTPGNAGSTCVIQATKALDANYNSATSSTQTITINKISQTVSFTSTAPASPVSGDTYTPLATASSGAIPTISIDAASSSVCEINAGIITFNTSGTCTVKADSSSSTNYNAATTATQSITVAKIAQSITFAQPIDSNFGDSNRTMSASASSGLALTYTRGASTTNTACSVSSSGVVTILAVGNCQVTASQSGNSQYDSAVSVSRTFAVNAIVPSAPFITSVSAGNASATVSFTAPSSNGGASLSAYELIAMPTSGSNVTKSNCSTTASPLACTITGLSNGTSYTFKVAAINSAGTGTYSSTSGSFTPATVANSVVNLVAQPGDGSLVVNWDQPTNLGGGSFTRYDIYYKSSGSYSGTANKQITSISDTTWTFTGLANGTSYDVKVVAITSANASELAGNTAEVSQYPSTVASAPTNVSASKLTATSARISWGLPLTDGGAALDATTPYVVTITGGPSPITCGTISNRTCDISGLNPASTYSISVKAQNRMGLGTAGTATYLVPSNDANLFSMDLKTGTTLSDLATANYSPPFDANTTSYSISVANSQASARITPSVNEATATVKVNGVTVSSGSPRNVSLGIGANFFTVEITAGDLVTTKTYSLTITRPKASQTPISITSANSVNYGSTITLTTTGGSGNGLVSFATTGTCTTSFSGGNYILTPGDVGSSCAIVATKAADDDYFAANSASQTITINKTTPTLSGFSNISKTFGDPTFTINEPTVSGSAPGVFTYSSSNTAVAILTGTTINVAGYGSSTITATFTPTSSTNYNSVIATLIMNVAKKILRVTPSDKSKFYGASHPTINNSVIGLVGSDEISEISYTYAGTGSTSYFASTTNPSNAGTYSITPLITSLSSGSLNNYDITYDEAALTISKVDQSALNITSSTSATYGENLTLSTSGGSGSGAITITKVSGDCTLNNSGSTYSITPGDAGNTCVVGATKAADTNYNAISASDQTITIGKANQTLAFTSTSSSPRINDTYTPVVTSRHSSNGTATGITPTISIDSSSSAICSINAGVITFDAQGSCVINADAGSSSNYNAASTTSQTVTVAVVQSANARTAAITINTELIKSNIKNIIEKLLPEIKNPGNIINLPSLNNLNLKPLFPTRAVPVLPNNLDTGLAITDNLGRLPLSQPGEKQMKVGNEFVPVVERVSPEGAMTLSVPESMNVAPIQMAIQSTDIKGQNMPAPDDGIIRAIKGQTITVAGDGLTPGSKFSVWLFSEPTKLGEGIVSADSTFKQVFMVPDGLPTGSHTLQINGMNSDKKVVSLTTGVIVTEVKQIVNVSSSSSELLAYSIILIFILLSIIAFLLRYIRRQQINLWN